MARASQTLRALTPGFWFAVFASAPAFAEDIPQAAAAAASAQAVPTAWIAPTTAVFYLVPLVVLLGALIAILTIRKALPATWSLADALSEEVSIKPAVRTTTTPGANGGPAVTVVEPLFDKDDKPILLPEMRASSSRVIALMGMIAMLFMYIGFGVFALFGFGASGQLPSSMSGAINFLVAGMTLFAPYAVNKFASLFQNIAGGK